MGAAVYRTHVQDFRLRTVAARADSSTQWWPRWAPLIVWIIACAVLSAALVHLSPLVYGWETRDELVQLFRLAPMLAVAVLFLVFRDPNRRPVLVLARRPSWRMLLATGIALLTGAVVVVTTLAARDTFLGVRTALPVLGPPLLATIAAAVVTALCEEVAWRGWLQPELEQWWGPLLAAVAVGFTWGLWYALIRRPDVDHAVTFLLMTMALSVAIRAILQIAPGHNLIIATAGHAALNVGMLAVLPGRGEDPVTTWSLVIASWIVAIALWLASRFRPVQAWASPVDSAELAALADAEIAEAELAEAQAQVAENSAELAEARMARADLAEHDPTGAGYTEAEFAESEFAEAELAEAERTEDGVDDTGAEWHWTTPDEPDDPDPHQSAPEPPDPHAP